MTTALITGGCGFLGSHLAEKLLNEGAKLFVVDNFSTALRSNADYLRQLPSAATQLTIIEADAVQPWQNWAPPALLQSKLDLVFHFASPASPPIYQKLGLETMLVNSVGLLQAIQFADTKKARVIFASTSEIYGDPEISPQPETYKGNVNTVGPRACYDESKRFGESLLYTLNARNGTRHGIVRIFNTYGPRMNPNDGRVIINFLCQALRGEKLTVYGQGQQSRSFCYVDDLVQGILAFARSPESGPMNLGNEKEFTILELAQSVQKLFKSQKLAIEYQALPIDDPRQRCPDLSLARKKLNWEARVPLAEGLEKMTTWLQSIGTF